MSGKIDAGIAGNASAIPARIVVFGDPLGSDALTVVVRVVAFLLVVAAATLIPVPARAAGEPEPGPEAEPRRRGQRRQEVPMPVEAG